MKLSFRIIVPRYEKEDQFRQLLDFLEEHRDAVDELTLFTEYWHHGYFPLDAFEERCRILKDRVARLRERGFGSVGINMLATLGHFDEAWDWLAKLPYGPAVGWDGKASTSSFCPNSAEFRAYIARKYELVAEAKPDFIWVDDDIRMFSLGVDYACFCPECLRIFNETYGTTYDRETLAGELNGVGGGIWRERWVGQNKETITRLLSHIEEAVHRVDPGIELGFMTVSLSISTYTGVDYENWFKALKSSKGRPGGGFFEDAQPFGFIRKVHEVGRQISHYPDAVTDIQYELENFPYHKLSKSVHVTLLECTAALASGANGVAFNVLKGEEGSLAEFHDVMRGIRASKPLWTAMDRIAGTYRNAGLHAALPPAYEALRNVDESGWFTSLSIDSGVKAYVLSEIGIPLSSYPQTSCGTVLSGNLAEGYTTEELKEMLGQGVLMDGRSLEILTERGLGGYCGVSVEKSWDNGVYERLTDDPLNGKYAGECRDARNSMYKGQGYVLKPIGDGVRVLSRLISYTETDLGPTVTAYENELGGRVAVLGYSAWVQVHSAVKRTQVLQISDWVSRGRLPAVIDRCIKVVPFVKRDPADGGRWLAMLLNASLDGTGAFETRIRHSGTAVEVFELLPDGRSVRLPESDYRTSEGETEINVEPIGAWQYRIFHN